MNNGWNLEICGRREVYVYHVDANDPEKAQFVARFKHASPLTNARAFAKFLQANFTPEEYFAAYAAGTPPLMILEAKGYVSPNRKRAEKLNARAAFEQRFADSRCVVIERN
jgi:hypothetical protein